MRNICMAKECGFCAGVRRAVDAVLQEAEKNSGAPIYILHDLVHNETVINKLKQHHIQIVEHSSSVPEGATLFFSAHGVSEVVEKTARSMPIHVIDATCPLVKHVHAIAAEQDKNGYTVLLAGKRGHREVEGILGRIPSGTGILIASAKEAEVFQPEHGKKYVLLSQTTFLADEFTAIGEVLKSKIPDLKIINTICRSTSQRQLGIKELANKCPVVLVVGSEASSNSKRLCEAAAEAGAKSFLVSTGSPIPEDVFGMDGDIGIASGASASEEEVQGIADLLLKRLIEKNQ